jgi:hypothetical protein
MTNFIKIELPSKVKVKTLGNKEIEIEKIEIFEIVDSNSKKTVTASCINHPTKIVLWSGDAYDAIGEWTTQNVIDRVLELYTT